MEIKQVNNVLGALGFGKNNKLLGTTFKWNKKGGMAGAKKVVKVIQTAQTMGYTLVHNSTQANPSGTVSNFNTLVHANGSSIETFVRYGATAASNDFTVYVRFPSIEV